MKLLCALPLVILFVSCNQGLGPVVPQVKVERQMLGLLGNFDLWDFNGDGRLDLRELDRGISKTTDYRAAEVLDFYDTNRDGGISLREAQDGYARAGEAQQRVADPASRKPAR
jgi:hypothetical protein